jgi:hypothetical protein
VVSPVRGWPLLWALWCWRYPYQVLGLVASKIARIGVGNLRHALQGDLFTEFPDDACAFRFQPLLH